MKTPNNSVSKREELENLLIHLVEAPSENPPGETTNVAEVCHQFLSERGFKPQRVESVTGHVSIISKIGKSPRITLVGHLDTVPAGIRELWRHDPFSAELRDGKVFGLGTADMKGGVAALLVAFTSLMKHESQIDGANIALVCDEETGGLGGSGHLISNQLLESKNVIIGEPTNSPNGCVIVAGERGALGVRLAFRGSPWHSSLPMLGSNAITTAVRTIPTLEKIAGSKLTTPHDAKPLIAAGRRWLLQMFNDVRKPQQALDHYSVTVSLIRGGTARNVVPGECTIDIDVRLPPGGSKEYILQQLARHAPSASLEVTAFSPPSYTTRSNALVRHLRQSILAVTHQDAQVVYAPFTTDAHYFRNGFGAAAVSFGPGDISVIHRRDEYVTLDDVQACCDVYFDSALRLNAVPNSDTKIK